MKNAQQFSHEMILSVNLEDGIFIDATAGNGHDTLFLAQHIEKGSKILAFDIQEQAILQTRQLLQNHDFEHKVTFILDSHAQISNYLDDQDLVRLAIFNLGYLPSADKSVITQPQTTIEALEKLCHLLVKGGRIAIMIYYGHEGGDIERDAVLDFVSQLNQQEYTAAIYRTLNQVNNPPFLVMIEKLERYRHG